MKPSQMLRMSALSVGLMSVSAWPAMAQSVVEKDCSSGKVWIPDDGLTVHIAGHCQKVQVMGNGNTVTVDSFDDLKVGGDRNTIQHRMASDAGVKTWLGGDRNTIQHRMASDAGVKTWLGGDGNSVTAIAGAASVAAKPQPKREAATRPAKTARPSVAASGKGNGLSGVSQILKVKKSFRTGDFTHFDYHIYALYKNGAVLVNPTVPIPDLNKSSYQASHASKWGQWKKNGQAISVKFPKNDAFWQLKGSVVAEVKPVNSGMTLNGTYKWSKTSGSMTFGANVSRASYTFLTGGRYEMSKSAMRGSGMDVGIGSSGAATGCDKTGGMSASSAKAPGGSAGTSRVRSDCGNAMTGAYAIDGYGITLQADNGAVHRLPFYVVSNNTVVIGDRWYWQDR